MISALVNEPEKDLSQIIVSLGLEIAEKSDDEFTTGGNTRSKSGSVSKNKNNNSLTSGSSSSGAGTMSSMVFSSNQMPNTTPAFSSPKNKGSASAASASTSVPFASNWTATVTSVPASSKSRSVTTSTPASSPAKAALSSSMMTSSASPDQMKHSSVSPFSSVRPSSQPFPSKSPNPAGSSAGTQASTTSEYTPFTNPSLFGKVGSVWGSKDQKLNFATVAARGSAFNSTTTGGVSGGNAGNTISGSGVGTGAAAGSGTTIDSSGSMISVEPSKAPGFRGNFVSPSSSASSTAASASHAYSTNQSSGCCIRGWRRIGTICSLHSSPS